MNPAETLEYLVSTTAEGGNVLALAPVLPWPATRGQRPLRGPAPAVETQVPTACALVCTAAENQLIRCTDSAIEVRAPGSAPSAFPLLIAHPQTLRTSLRRPTRVIKFATHWPQVRRIAVVQFHGLTRHPSAPPSCLSSSTSPHRRCCSPFSGARPGAPMAASDDGARRSCDIFPHWRSEATMKDLGEATLAVKVRPPLSTPTTRPSRSSRRL